MNHRRLDLNLLMLFEALVSESSVTAAARRLHLSQSAMSHGLARLRETFDDPVLERRGRAMVATARATAALPEVREILRQATRLLGAGQRFDPATGERSFRIGASDYACDRAIAGLAAQLRRRAPGIRLVIRHAGRVDAPQMVRNGELDLAFGVFPSLTPDLRASTVEEEPYRCAIGPGGRAGAARRKSQPLSVAAYLAATHVNVMVQGETLGLIDEALARKGVQRQIGMVVAHFSSALKLVASTDLWLTAPAGLFEAASITGITLHQPPLDLPAFRTQMIWSNKREGDAGLEWLRQMAVPEPPSATRRR